MLQKVRDNDNFMKLSRMGSRYPSRLSFSRSMLRRLINDKWEIHKSKFDLDKVIGVGEVLKKRLIRKYKSLKNIKLASKDDLMTVKGINEKIAKQIQKI